MGQLGVDEVLQAAKQASSDRRSRVRAIETVRFVVTMRRDEVDGGCRDLDGLAEVSLRAVDLLVAGSGDMFVLAGAYRHWLDEFVADSRACRISFRSGGTGAGSGLTTQSRAWPGCVACAEKPRSDCRR